MPRQRLAKCCGHHRKAWLAFDFRRMARCRHAELPLQPAHNDLLQATAIMLQEVRYGHSHAKCLPVLGEARMQDTVRRHHYRDTDSFPSCDASHTSRCASLLDTTTHKWVRCLACAACAACAALECLLGRGSIPPSLVRFSACPAERCPMNNASRSRSRPYELRHRLGALQAGYSRQAEIYCTQKHWRGEHLAASHSGPTSSTRMTTFSGLSPPSARGSASGWSVGATKLGSPHDRPMPAAFNSASLRTHSRSSANPLPASSRPASERASSGWQT